MTPCIRLLCSSVLLLAAPPTLAQGAKADYDRASRLEHLWSQAFHAPDIHPQWIDGHSLWYATTLNGRTQYQLIDGLTKTARPLFDHDAVARALNTTPDKLAFDRLEIRGDSLLALTPSGAAWNITLSTSAAAPASDDDAKVFQLQPLLRQRDSATSTLSTAIIFKNNTDKELSIYWVDNEGRKRQYGTLKPGETRRQHTFSGHVWIATDAAGNAFGTYAGSPLPSFAIFPAPAVTEGQSNKDQPADLRGHPAPDLSFSIITSNNNLGLYTAATNDKRALTTDGSPQNSFGGPIFYSPDSKYAIAMRTKPAQSHPVYTVESSPRDRVEPKLHTHEYLKAGDQIAVSKPWLISLADGTVKEVPARKFPNPWDISNHHWLPDSSEFFFVYNQRGHQLMRLLALNPASNTIRTIIEENSNTFFDYSSKLSVTYLDNSQEIIWASERDGLNHLFLYDSHLGTFKNQITHGHFVVRGIEFIDEAHRQIYFRACGIIPDQDPYYIHLARINFDGSDLKVLTQGNGTHEIQWSPDHSFFLDHYSRVDMAPVLELRSANGDLIQELSRADTSELSSAGWKAPERFVAKGRDSKTDIYGIILRPSNFDNTKKYPIIENIYAGPHDSFTPKAFKVWYGHQQEIAELGFIVVQMDGMGTNNRGRAFHDVCYKNLADSGFPDRIAWIKAAAAAHPEMDLTRIGIYGGSAGGQSALRALIDHHDFYKAAAADCACHDNRMDKIWWNEAWMGYPIDDSYEKNSNVTQAHKMEGKLLLTVGELDTNVDPASTMQVVNALIRANKDFDLIVFPGSGHGAAESPYGRRRREDFFVRNLLGIEPRAN